MKKIFALLLIAIFIPATFIKLKSQTTVPGGLVYGTWTFAGSPYQVQGSIQIPNDSTLTIQPGVIVEFQGNYKFITLGRLLAMGTALDSIMFTAANTVTGWKGLRIENTTNNNDTTKLYYCKFLYGKAQAVTGSDGYGGGILVKAFSKVIISNSKFSNCTAIYGGGAIACRSGSNPIIKYNLITNCSTNLNANGGGMLIESNPLITHNTISNCTSGYYGGGISCENVSSYPVISDNIISNNTCAQNGGGIYCYNGSYPTISNNLICNNRANSTTEGGGGIYFMGYLGSTVYSTCINNTIVNNSAVNGGGIYCAQKYPATFRNTILWGNTASALGPQVFLEDDPSDPAFYYCDLQGGSAAIDPNGNIYTGTYQNNINSNPLFVSPSAGSGAGFSGVAANWTLQSGSPCIDTGDPNTLTPATDIAGNPRVNVCRIDVGAYEYQTGVPFAVSVSQFASIPCNGYLTGALAASATGSGAPYTYSWNPGGSTNDSLIGVGAGVYTVTATNSGGCVRTATITITEPNGMTVNSSQTNIACNGNCTGSATVTVTGGTTPYHYQWTSGANDTLAATPATLCNGPYTVTVTDNGGCVKTTTVTITNPSSLSFTTVLQQVSCFGGNDGKITVNATGGTGALQYSKDGGTTYQSSNVFTGLTVGTYGVVVKDVNACQTSIVSIVITEPPLLTATTTQIDVKCFGANSGSATAFPNGGTPSYSFAWNTLPVQTTATANNLVVGNYTVTVTDLHACVTTATVAIVSTLPLPNICMITVDSMSQNNVIYWDKTGFSSVDSFFIYRDTANNNYARIGKVPYDSLSRFIDTVRSLYTANGDPNVTSWRYKIAVKDSCGSMSPKSPYHQTMFFQNSSGNFSWNHYQIEGQTTPVPALSNYLFKRDDISNGTWATIQNLSASSTAYTDPAYATYVSTGSWRVETQWSITCNPTYKVAPGTFAAVAKSRSNVQNNFAVTGIKTITEKDFILMPNPANDFIIIQSKPGMKNVVVEIYDVMGKRVIGEVGVGNSVQINTTNLSNGIYSVRIISENGKAVKKLVIEK